MQHMTSKCKIDRTTRRKCTACRFAKCKAVGMKHSTCTLQQSGNVSELTPYEMIMYSVIT